MATQSEYETALAHFAYVERAKVAAKSLIEQMTGTGCPFWIDAKDVDCAVAGMNETITELFFTGKSEAEEVIAQFEAREQRTHERLESTYAA